MLMINIIVVTGRFNVLEGLQWWQKREAWEMVNRNDRGDSEMPLTVKELLLK